MHCQKTYCKKGPRVVGFVEHVQICQRLLLTQAQPGYGFDPLNRTANERPGTKNRVGEGLGATPSAEQEQGQSRAPFGAGFSSLNFQEGEFSWLIFLRLRVTC